MHSNFSLLDGACHIEQVTEKAHGNNMPAVACTDHGVMYGMIDFYQKARAGGVKPILGCEVYVAPGSRFDKKSTSQETAAHHLVLLAQDFEGYQNLCKLVTDAHLEGFYYKPRIDRDLLAEYSRGLIGLSACLKGEVAYRLNNGDNEGAERIAGEYCDILGKDNFYLELQDHGLKDQKKVNPLILDMARRNGIPYVATNDVHYLEKEHAEAHEVLLCMQTQTVLSDPKRMKYGTHEFYMKTREEMEEIFGEIPEALDRTVEVAERCNVELEFGKLHFPTFTVPEQYTQKQYLIKLCKDGLSERYGLENPDKPKDENEQKIVDRMLHEFDVIEKTGFINYFLVVWDFINFSRRNNIAIGPGRGSGGGSVVAYALGITSIDPLRFGLLFERFLNPERISPPDFDIDFCKSRREEVIDYVIDKYGEKNVAQIITFGSLGAKLVVRDVGRVLEIPYAKCDQLSKMIPDDPKMTLKKALEMNPEFQKAYKQDPDCKQILDYGFVLEGLYRNPGTHAAGVVIGEKPLREIVPLSRDKDKQPVTQYTMKPLEKIGLLKMDFLGLRTLTVIRHAVDLIKEFRDTEIDIENLPHDDQTTFELLNRGDTIGVFQLESEGMRDLIRRIGIDRIEDLIAMIALYRPGPMNMLDDYVNRKSGRAKIKYDHPLLEDVLKETYGVMLYQEEVMKAANVLAGFTMGEADVLRDAMGKKKMHLMGEQRQKFIKGCKETNNIAEKQAGKIFDTIESFAGYGFNKAHSTGYAIISYQTAFLKANYPAEFMSALLTSEIGNFDKLPFFVSETEQMGLDLLAPDINSSDTVFKPASKNAIRYGLAGIKNVGQSAAETIVREREENGPYTDLINFCSRLCNRIPTRKLLESLIRCGALDSIDKNRARLFNAIEYASSRAEEEMQDRLSGQGNLFDLMESGPAEAISNDLPDSHPWSQSELLAGEKELLGVYMSGHPLTEFAPLLQRYQLTDVNGLPELEEKSLTRLGGIISAVTKKVTRSSKKMMAILQVEDLDGDIEVLVFPEKYETYAGSLVKDSPVLICGEVSRRDDKPKLIAHEVYPLAEAPTRFAQKISLLIPTASLKDSKLDDVKNLLAQYPGKTKVGICLEFPTGEKVFLDADREFRVFPSEELVQQLQHELGEESVFVHVNPEPLAKGRPSRKNGNRSFAKT